MKCLRLCIWSGFALALSACAVSRDATNDPGKVVDAVHAVIEGQQTSWNRGDIESFMDGYQRAETTMFVSGDELTRDLAFHSADATSEGSA